MAVALIVPPKSLPHFEKGIAVLSDLENLTGEADFPVEGAKKLLEVDLAQTKRFGLLHSIRKRDALLRMGKSENDTVTAALGKEICEREGVGPLIAWRAEKVDKRLRFLAQIINPLTNEILVEIGTTPVLPDQMTEGIEELGKDLRWKLGDPLIEASQKKPLPEATTPSIAALRAYSLAERHLSRFEYPEAETELNSALGQDPHFALALRQLASLYEQQGAVAKARGLVERAYQERFNLTEAEQAAVSEYYFLLFENDPDKALQTMADFVKRYPLNATPLGSLADTASRLMKFEQAKAIQEKERELLRIPPYGPAFGPASLESAANYWATHMDLNEFEAALRIAEQVRTAAPTKTLSAFLLVPASLGLDDVERAEREVARLRHDGEIDASLWLGGLIDVQGGRLRDGYDQWTRYVERARTRDTRNDPWWFETKGTASLGLARVAFIRGRPEDVRRNLQGVKNVRDEFLAEAGKYYARIGEVRAAREILAQLKGALEGHENNYNLALLQLLEGEIDLQDGNAEKGFELIAAAASYSWRYLYLQAHESLGNSALRTGRAQEAMAAYDEILSNKKGFAVRWERPDDWVLAQFGLGLSTDAAKKGDAALTYYAQFRRYWNMADPDIPALVSTQERICRAPSK
jgi:eukaryotic-like serine/threonine-protein kinase